MFGTPIAVGNDSNELEPWGASRLYFTEDTWKERVIEQAKESSLIFVMVDATPALLWEMETLPQHTDLNKFVFLFPPGSIWDDIGFTDSLEKASKYIQYFPKTTEVGINKHTHIGFVVRDGGVEWIHRKDGYSKYFSSLASFIRSRLPKRFFEKHYMARSFQYSAVFFVTYFYSAIIVQVMNNNLFRVFNSSNLLYMLVFMPVIIMIVGFLFNLMVGVARMFKYLFYVASEKTDP